MDQVSQGSLKHYRANSIRFQSLKRIHFSSVLSSVPAGVVGPAPLGPVCCPCPGQKHHPLSPMWKPHPFSPGDRGVFHQEVRRQRPCLLHLWSLGLWWQQQPYRLLIFPESHFFFFLKANACSKPSGSIGPFPDFESWRSDSLTLLHPVSAPFSPSWQHFCSFSRLDS